MSGKLISVIDSHKRPCDMLPIKKQNDMIPVIHGYYREHFSCYWFLAPRCDGAHYAMEVEDYYETDPKTAELSHHNTLTTGHTISCPICHVHDGMHILAVNGRPANFITVCWFCSKLTGEAQMSALSSQGVIFNNQRRLLGRYGHKVKLGEPGLGRIGE